MITVITGTPGAGKTLYAISKLIQPLVGTTVKHTQEDGTVEEVPRTIYTNINGLLLDHELIDGGENNGLRDWWKWAKPGSVIVFDEVQRIWQPRPTHARQQWRARIETRFVSVSHGRSSAHARQQWRARIETTCRALWTAAPRPHARQQWRARIETRSTPSSPKAPATRSPAMAGAD